MDALSDDAEDLQADLVALAGPSTGPSGGSIFVDGFSGGQLPAKESIREIRINQNPFSPEYDRISLGRIEILTKPGTAKLRGAVSGWPPVDFDMMKTVSSARRSVNHIDFPLSSK